MKSYDPKKVSLLLNGFYIVGFMDGTFISAEKNEDNVIPHVGGDGEVTYTESADNTGTITFTLKQNSSSLAYIHKLIGLKTTFSCRVVDGNKDNGNVKVGGSKCRIIKTPGREFANEVSGVEVQVHVSDYAVS